MKKILIANALYPESFPQPVPEPVDVLLTDREKGPGSEQIHLIKPQKGAFSSEELMQHIPSCDAFIPMFNTPVSAHLLSLGKNLKVVSNVGVGYNNIDVDAATRLGITVCNTPDVVTEPTAELTIAMLLDLARGITRSHVAMQQKQEKWGVLENIGMDVYGKTLGIIGFGRIGKAVAKRALAMGMRIVYYSRTKQADAIVKEYQATYVSLEQLMKTSDFVSLHTPLTSQTHHLIGKKELELCKPTAYLINTARGAVVHEEALIEALQQEMIAGAALDVYEFEPQVSDSLRCLTNVLLVPHIGTATRETRNHMAAMALQNVVEYFNGNPVRVVNP